MGRVGSLPGVAIARASSGDMIAVAASAYSSTLTGTYRISRPTTAPISAAGSVRSKGGVPAREPIRTPTPRPASRCATRRPVLPVPPVTSTSSLMPSSLRETC